MKKRFALCIIPILILLFVIGWNLKKEFQPELKVSLIQKIGESPCAKFEYCESTEREVFITGERRNFWEMMK